MAVSASSSRTSNPAVCVTRIIYHVQILRKRPVRAKSVIR